MGWRSPGGLGAVLRDLEFVQFHPTALHQEGAPHFLISEAVRGEGAHLVDAQGDRFAFNYDPAGELAPRDVVSRAIFQHLLKTNQNLRKEFPRGWEKLPDQASDRKCLPGPAPDPDRDTIKRRFPKIIQVCQKYGIDVFSHTNPGGAS
jgi:L-aspartate oxidase